MKNLRFLFWFWCLLGKRFPVFVLFFPFFSENLSFATTKEKIWVVHLGVQVICSRKTFFLWEILSHYPEWLFVFLYYFFSFFVDFWHFYKVGKRPFMPFLTQFGPFFGNLDSNISADYKYVLFFCMIWTLQKLRGKRISTLF